jgi:hypothetical protein
MRTVESTKFGVAKIGIRGSELQELGLGVVEDRTRRMSHPGQAAVSWIFFPKTIELSRWNLTILISMAGNVRHIWRIWKCSSVRQQVL